MSTRGCWKYREKSEERFRVLTNRSGGCYRSFSDTRGMNVFGGGVYRISFLAGNGLREWARA